MERSKPDLKPRRILTIALVLALGVPALFSLLPGCESTPAEPEYNNPFDPEGPDAGDPLKLTAIAQDDATIDLRWNQPQNLGITSTSSRPTQRGHQLGRYRRGRPDDQCGRLVHLRRPRPHPHLLVQGTGFYHYRHQ